MEKDYPRWLERSLQISKEAGREILKIYYQTAKVETSYKDDRSPLTEADKRAHSLIEQRLKELTPDYPVLTEESKSVPYTTRSKWEHFWLVDPLDGTKEFLKRNGEFTVNIALIHQNRPVIGVVHAPALQRTYAAALNEPAFREEQGGRKRIYTADYRQGELVIVASRSHAGGERMASFVKQIGPAKIVSIGSALKICMVAEGEAHLYPRLGPTMEWDTAAAHCILRKAGGSLLTLEGEELSYNRRNMKNPEFMACGSPPFPWEKYFHKGG